MDDWFQHAINVMEAMTPPSFVERVGGKDVIDDILANATLKLSRTMFFWILAWSVTMTLTLDKAHRSTQLSLLCCFLYLLIPSGLLFFSFDITLADVVARGLVTAIISSDLVIGRMANRELSPFIVIINMAALVSNLFSFILVPFYYSAILFEVTSFTKLPLLSKYINVYSDGIYDMCHLGHMKAFKNAAKHGTRLFVGVSNDEDAMIYKRQPIMSAKERYEVVAACKHVYKVIPDAPTHPGTLTKEFLKKHRIHIVCCGEEYDNDPNDEYYKVPREMGITRVLPRTSGMSTSEIIRRVKARDDNELKRKQDALMDI
jgi:cytidyltransferase-like protein